MYEDFIGQRLAVLRQQKNVSARDMSLSIGQNQNYISHIESRKMLPSMQALFYICEYLGIKPKDFFDDEKQPSLLQHEAISYIYELNDDDVEMIIGFIKR
ncbi:MAG: helix-turn-helix transcriptional regulator, partial [Christensenellaceae bacterium]